MQCDFTPTWAQYVLPKKKNSYENKKQNMGSLTNGTWGPLEPAPRLRIFCKTI